MTAATLGPKKYSQELVFKAVKIRKRSGCVNRQEARSKFIFLRTKATHF